MDTLLDLLNLADDLANTFGLSNDSIPGNFDPFDNSVPFPDDFNTFDNSVPFPGDFNTFDNSVPFPGDFNTFDNSAPFDIFGYGGLATLAVFGLDALSPFDIYSYDRSVPYDVYGFANNSIVGSVSNDRLIGSAGNDVIYGDGGFDIITGEAGNDTLIASDDGGFLAGGSGDDVLYAGFGQTFMQGDSGRDVFVLSAATTIFDPAQTHVLLDFNDNTFDRGNTGDALVISNTLPGEFVNLFSGADFNFFVSGADTFVNANDTVITLGSNGGFLGVVVGQTPDEVARSLVIS
jgi:Ca2+-binding RTX toxin-like protein